MLDAISNSFAREGVPHCLGEGGFRDVTAFVGARRARVSQRAVQAVNGHAPGGGHAGSASVTTMKQHADDLQLGQHSLQYSYGPNEFLDMKALLERIVSASVDPASAVRRTWHAALTSKLRCLETTRDLAAHSASVRHFTSTPDGKYLATRRCMDLLSMPRGKWDVVYVACGGRDRTCVMFKVG
jgi:hypothetical protein